MGKTIGIDLGTTNSCFAVYEGGDATVLENSEGGRTTPSVVAFPEGGERLVGTIAKRQAVTNPERTVSSIKRFMGRKLPEVAEEETIVPYHLEAGPGGDVRVRIGDGLFSPPEISAMIMQKIKRDAEAKLGESVDSAVITVPAYFNDDQRQATKDAGRIAGLEVLRIINEPTAAALAYGLERGSEDEKVLIFDLGGGTFDVSVLEIGDGVFEVMATSGDNQLGGDNFDKAVVEWMIAEFQRDQGVDLGADKSALQRLYEAAEKAKIELSAAAETTISLPFITAVEGQPRHLEMRISRAHLVELCSGLLDRITDPLSRAIEDSGGEIDHVVLVGGMTRMPAVQEKVTQITGLEPHRGVNPDEVVATGAAIQAGALSGDVTDVLLLDVTPLSLGVETKGKIMTRLIERNTTIPVRRSEIFSTAEDNQASVEIHVLQGEGEMAETNKSLGRFQLAGIPPAARGVPQVEVTFDIDVDGILQVSATDQATGQAQEITIRGGSGLSDEEVESLLRQAEEGAERDRERRRLAEARNSRDAVIYSSERQLEQMDNLQPADREQISEAIEALKNTPDDDAAALEQAARAAQEAFHAFSARVYEQARSAAAQPPAHEEVVDAVIEEEPEEDFEEDPGAVSAEDPGQSSEEDPGAVSAEDPGK